MSIKRFCKNCKQVEPIIKLHQCPVDDKSDCDFVDSTDVANIGFLLAGTKDVVQIGPVTCCGIEWHSDGVVLGLQPDGRNVGWTKVGKCGICERKLTN